MHEPDARPVVPFSVTLAALVLAGCVLSPVDAREGTSMLEKLLDAFREDWLVGLTVTVVFGSPYLFALAVACSGTAGGAWASAWVRVQVALLQTEIVVLGLMVLHDIGQSRMRAPWALVGFAATTLVVFAHRIASPAVAERDRDVGFHARWGAILVAGAYAWFHLQCMGRGHCGRVVLGTLFAAVVLAAVAGRSRRRPPHERRS